MKKYILPMGIEKLIIKKEWANLFQKIRYICMQELLNQIRVGLDNNLYYLSLFASLAVPDICGALTTENGIATKEGYIKWFDINVAQPNGYFLTGIDCYYFRCSMVHQGTTQHLSSLFQRIIFAEPGNTTNIFHNNIILNALNIDVVIFCNDIIDSAIKWFEAVQDDPNFKKNYELFVRRYADGLLPFIAGVPVIG